MLLTVAFVTDEEYIERYYLGDFERDFTDNRGKDICYIPLPSGDMALYIDPHGSGGDVFFAYQDYQGTILAIADDNGGIVEEYSYDAWGNRRDVSTLENNYYPTGSNGVWQGFFHRGYTGHEHLECFGLINMNGRLYDPLLGRMLSPDKYVQAPDFSQNFNRYSYAWNNPLTYSDPSGDIIVSIAVGALIGAAIGATANVAYNYANGNINSFSDFGNAYLKGLMFGAVVGAAGVATAAGGLAMAGKSAVLSKAAGKKLFTSMVSGTINTISNYDKEQGFGLHTLGYFTAGAIGGYYAPGSLNKGMFYGGISNMAVSSIHNRHNEDYGNYQRIQAFTGGALSVFAAAGFAKIKPASFYTGKNKILKYGEKFIRYGSQGSAFDFAYTSEKAFKNRKDRQHLGIFISSGLGGIAASTISGLNLDLPGKGSLQEVLNFGSNAGLVALALTAEMAGVFWAKNNYEGFYRSGREQKSAYLIYKSILYYSIY